METEVGGHPVRTTGVQAPLRAPVLNLKWLLFVKSQVLFSAIQTEEAHCTEELSDELSATDTCIARGNSKDISQSRAQVQPHTHPTPPYTVSTPTSLNTVTYMHMRCHCALTEALKADLQYDVTASQYVSRSAAGLGCPERVRTTGSHVTSSSFIS